MNILICTSFDFRVPCAGLNRLDSMKNSLELYGNNLKIIASGNVVKNKKWIINSNGNISFNRNYFNSYAHSKTLRITSEAKKFYKNHLTELIDTYKISGIIIYSTQYQLILPLIKIGRKKKIFVVADMSEYFKISPHFLLNGMNYQQLLMKYFAIKKLSGLIATTPAFETLANKYNTPSVLIPGFLNNSKLTLNKCTVHNSKIQIVYMGRLVGRELPNVIMKSLVICKKKGLKFSFTILRGNSSTYRDKFWLWYVKKYKSLSKFLKIYGFLSSQTKEDILNNADLFIFLRNANTETDFIFPSRVPEFLNHAKPIIMSNVSPLNYFFKENKGVKFISSNNNPDDIANKIISLSKNQSKRDKIGLEGRKYAIKKYNKEFLGKKLNSFLKDIRPA